MPIELTPEDQAAAEAWVEAGRFQSVDEVVHVSMQNMRDQQEWNDYAATALRQALLTLQPVALVLPKTCWPCLLPTNKNRPDDSPLYRNGGRGSPRDSRLLPGPSAAGDGFNALVGRTVIYLADWPFTDHRRRDLTKRNVCFWTEDPFYFVVFIEHDVLTMVAVLHTSRNIASILRKRLKPFRRIV